MVRAILIDDEENALDLLDILLRQIGGVDVVGRYTDPCRALEDACGLQPDAIFLDIHMPGMLGTDTARCFSSALPRARIVFTTAFAKYAVEAFDIKSADYLVKPITAERLQLTVARLVAADKRY